LINQCSFARAVAKLGIVDVLKLDCEGAEWQIFEDRKTWKSVQRVAMEYHLWAKERSSVSELREALASLGFSRIEIRQDAPSFGMAFAAK
jgi:methyltransferase FkbM-like protein